MAIGGTTPTNLVRFGDEFELDLRVYELRRGGQPLKLERIPMELLLLLIERREQLVSREQIVERVWGKDVFLDTDNSINAAVRKIRLVLADDPEHPRFVQTLTGRGYRFIAPVQEIGPLQAVTIARDAEADASGVLIGKKISHYRILEVLGGGGMGVVYKAEDLKLGRRVALKFLPSELASDPKAFGRIQREARAASALDHPNICAIYELGEHDGQPFIVMQLLEGQTLREWIESAPNVSGTARLDEIAKFAVQIADGLEAAHQKNIIHRDIKPVNIFITNRGEAKILDFGVAKFLDTDASESTVGNGNVEPTGAPSGSPELSLTQSRESLGTPSYLSPEQVRGERLDARTDLFSFGLVLYEMATGKRGFSGSTATGIQNAVLHLPIVPARQLRPDIPLQLESIISKALQKDRTLRYQTAGDIRNDMQAFRGKIDDGKRAESGARAAYVAADRAVVATVVEDSGKVAQGGRRRSALRWQLAVVALVVASLIAEGVHLSYRHRNGLTAEDTVVVGDFANSTGDPIFDDTLKSALTLTLRQSPFLNILREGKIAKTLKLMTLAPTTALSPAIAGEVCQRAGSKAYVTGAIGSLGTQYVVGLRAVNCRTGDTLAQEQVTASSKEEVLAALGDAATKLRSELGESLTTVQKFDVPLSEATTSSLEALRNFSQGTKVWNTNGETEALPYFKRAVQLDPKFAGAWVSLGTIYNNVDRPGPAAESMSKAYELRERVSERERLSILGHYYKSVTGELGKAIPAYLQWQQDYPSDPTPHTNSGTIYAYLGQHEKALEQYRAALGVEPNGVLIYENLALTYCNLDRLDEASAMLEEAFARKMDDPSLHQLNLQVAFLRGDAATIQQIVAWSLGKPGVEDRFLAARSEVESYAGQMAKARESSRLAVESAIRSGSKETAALWQGLSALHEAEVGNLAEATKQAEATLVLAQNQDAQLLAALVFARARKDVRATAIADQLDHDHPLNTLVQSYWLPVIRAMLRINRGDSAGAGQALQVTVPIELGSVPPAATLYPIYLRGQSLLQSHQGAAAATEFENLLAHRQLAIFVTGSLANLQLGRAYAMSGDTARARSRYEIFFTSWKDADPEIPVLKQAKAEYAKLE
jgi:eukaryotic-like serine/threonine-protein kinase